MGWVASVLEVLTVTWGFLTLGTVSHFCSALCVQVGCSCLLEGASPLGEENRAPAFSFGSSDRRKGGRRGEACLRVRNVSNRRTLFCNQESVRVWAFFCSLIPSITSGFWEMAK